jgi:SAM-dependent methyltransferase
MRQENKDFLARMIEKFPDNFREPILEVGSFRAEGQEELADIRGMFPGKKFVGVDMRQGLGVDRIENAHSLKIPSNSVGSVICIDTLEHVESIDRAMSEMYRVLQPGGIVVIVSVMNFPIHDYPSDYWRFTPECFKKILKGFDNVVVEFDGDEKFPTGVYGAGIKTSRYSAIRELFSKTIVNFKSFASRKPL